MDWEKILLKNYFFNYFHHSFRIFFKKKNQFLPTPLYRIDVEVFSLYIYDSPIKIMLKACQDSLTVEK